MDQHIVSIDSRLTIEWYTTNIPLIGDRYPASSWPISSRYGHSRYLGRHQRKLSYQNIGQLSVNSRSTCWSHVGQVSIDILSDAPDDVLVEAPYKIHDPNSGGKASDLGTEHLFPTYSLTLKIISHSNLTLLNQSLPNKAGQLPCTTTRSRTFSSLEEYLSGTLPKWESFHQNNCIR